MIYRIQDSLDSDTWKNVPGYTFRSKKNLREWFELFEEANNLDWRVGFLIRCRDGKYFRAVVGNSDTQVKS